MAPPGGRALPLVWLFTAGFLAAGLPSGPAAAHAVDHLRTTDDIGPNKVPHRGQSPVLVIVHRSFGTVDDGYVAELRSFFRTEGGPGSFRSYWQETTRGRYDPVPTFIDPLVYDECIAPGVDPEECQLSLDEMQPLIEGALHVAMKRLLEDYRDRDGVDLRIFDKNGPDCAMGQECPDGWLDGVIVDTDSFGGLAFPFYALKEAVVVDPRPFGQGGEGAPEVKVGIIALSPPAEHEFAHTLGFIDSYNGPALNGLMASNRYTVSAYSRVKAGWGEATPLPGPGTYELAPVYDGGTLFQIGEPPYLMFLEARSGPKHEAWDASPPGLNAYSVDETTLPTTPLGFLDILAGDLYYPNQNPPYFNVNLPLGCSLREPENLDEGQVPCVLNRPGQWVELKHLITGSTGLWARVDAMAADGTLTVSIVDEQPPPYVPPPLETAVDAGEVGEDPPPASKPLSCANVEGDALAVALGLGWVVLLLGMRKRRRRR